MTKLLGRKATRTRKAKKKALEESKTLLGFITIRRRGESPTFQNMREYVRNSLIERTNSADRLLQLFASGVLTEEMFAQVLVDEDVIDEDAAKFLAVFMNHKDADVFTEMVEQIYGGLFLKNDLLVSVFHFDPKNCSAYEYRKYEQWFYRFVKHEQELFDDLFEKFMNKANVDALVRFGKRREEIFGEFVKSCIAYDVYPIISFPSGKGAQKYRLVFHTEKTEQMRRRAKSITTNMVHTTEKVLLYAEKGTPVFLPKQNGDFKALVQNGQSPVKVLRLPEPKPVKYAVVQKRREK